MISSHDPTYREYLAQLGLRSLGFNPGTPDNFWGPKSEEAYQAFLASLAVEDNHCIASTFADEADVAAFRKCKAQGKSDTACFAIGDNGEGAWGDDTTGATPMVALPPETLLKRFTSLASARLASLILNYKGKQANALVGDLMPHLANITNGAGIDLNPACVEALGIPKGGMVPVTWRWV